MGMSLTPCSVPLRYSAKGAVVKKIPLLNKNFVHFINNIFWNMGFKTETHAEKVIPNIHIISIMPIKLIISFILIILIMLNYITYTHYTHCADYIDYTNYTHYFAGSYGSRNC